MDRLRRAPRNPAEVLLVNQTGRTGELVAATVYTRLYSSEAHLSVSLMI